ncbi:hypothetical protein [Crenobacter cavernae]|nr:hypothetical protein [Crenobacter cavernae]
MMFDTSVPMPSNIKLLREHAAVLLPYLSDAEARRQRRSRTGE